MRFLEILEEEASAFTRIFTKLVSERINEFAQSRIKLFKNNIYELD